MRLISSLLLWRIQDTRFHVKEETISSGDRGEHFHGEIIASEGSSDSGELDELDGDSGLGGSISP